MALQTRLLKSAVEEFLAATGKPKPGDARVLSACLGMRLAPWRKRGSALRGNRIRYDSRAELHEQQRQIGECVARRVLERAQLRVTEANARYVARQIVACLSVPGIARASARRRRRAS